MEKTKREIEFQMCRIIVYFIFDETLLRIEQMDEYELRLRDVPIDMRSCVAPLKIAILAEWTILLYTFGLGKTWWLIYLLGPLSALHQINTEAFIVCAEVLDMRQSTVKYAMRKTGNDARGIGTRKREPSISNGSREKKTGRNVTLDVWTVNGRGALWRSSSVSLSLLVFTFLLFKFTTIIIIIIMISFTHYFFSTPFNYYIVLLLRPLFPVPDYSFRTIYSDCIVLAARALRAFLWVECLCVRLHLAMYNLSQLLHTSVHR